jgi:nudix-type nucleoside diphosphatase (YffH/AdpP family)
MRRELEEEIGYRVDDMQPIYTFYLSPGICSERTTLFYAAVTADSRVTSGGGLNEEGEDIRVVRLAVAEAFALLDAGAITDARTIIALEWLRRNKYG